MLELKKGIDIVTDLGKVTDAEQAEKIFRDSMDDDSFGKIQKIKNQEARLKVANAIAMGRPDSVFVNTGSEEDKERIRTMCLEKGEERTLATPGHTIHYDLAKEQGRIVDRTFYIANESEKVSSLANRISREEAHAYVTEHMVGMMQGMILVVCFFARGPVGAKATIPAIEMTTSWYVCHSAELLYRNCFDAFDAEADRVGHFFTNIHCQGPNRDEDLPNARVFMDRSHRITYSTFCTYAGNTLLLKKGNHRFAVDRATYFNKGEELSEHMFVTGLKGPGGRITYFAGAAPSGCGKTTTALVGDQLISDDLAQIWIADDGTVRSVNPECGIFGIIEDVNAQDDPIIYSVLRGETAEVIFSNMLVDADDKPHWVGSLEDPPEKGVNFQGEWRQGKTDDKGNAVPMSHPNARFTIRTEVLSNCGDKLNDPEGVPTRVFTYNGRDYDTMPPLRVARNTDEGVVIGASVVSMATATEVGASGLRRQPWANQPFIPGGLGDNMVAQLEFYGSEKIAPENRPVMAGINYFLTEGARGGEGAKLLGEKRDVRVWMGWLERLAHGEMESLNTPIGLMPKYDDLAAMFSDILDKPYPRQLYDRQFGLYTELLLVRLNLLIEAFEKEEDIPDILFTVYSTQKKQLEALQKEFGEVVTPEQADAWMSKQ